MTDLKPTKITFDDNSEEQLLYFTSPCLLNDDHRLIVISDKNGQPNIFLVDPEKQLKKQLSSNNEGDLKSYKYFNGNPYRGLGRASVCFNPCTETIYFIQDQKICSVDLEGTQHVLNDYPRGLMTAYIHVSADGSQLAIPFTEERIFDGDRRFEGLPDYDVDERVRREKLSSYLNIYDTSTGELIVSEKVSCAAITHVQFSPISKDMILYNHEWTTQDRGIRRMWLWDKKQHRPVRSMGEGRSLGDWSCHEHWKKDGSGIVYHGGLENGPHYIGMITADLHNIYEIPLVGGSERYGHFFEGPPGFLVSDGYFKLNKTDAEEWCPWISLLKVNWEEKQLISWEPLCRHGSEIWPEDNHAHPIFNNKGDAVYYTSNVNGKRAVYKVDLNLFRKDIQ